MKKLFYILLSLILFTACNDDDTFSTSRSNLLSFTTDTIKMDTVFARIPASTHTSIEGIWVYNNSNDGIRCSNVRLQKGNQSGFRVNVDGIYLGEKTGYQTNDIEVRKGDSIRIFVELTAPDNGSAVFKQIEDNLIFRLESGVEQVINLNACAWNAEIVRNLEIKNDTTIDTTISGKALVVYGGITVDSLATLTIAPGTKIFFHDDAGIDVKGRLICQGTAEKNILLRCDRLDDMLDNVPYDLIPGRWQGIHFSGDSYDNVIDYTEIHGGSNAVVCDSSDVTRRKLTINSSTIHNCKGYGLALVNSNVYVANTQITNSLRDCVSVWGGDLCFVHNTIAQFYIFDSGIGAALRFSNTDGTNNYPLVNLEVKNCIITGEAEDNIMVGKSDAVAFNYHFCNSILRTPEVEDTALTQYFDSIIWETKADTTCIGKKNFKRIDDVGNYNNHDYIYDFHLDSISKANGAANPQWALPLNRDGLPRDEKNMNIGCY